jgi:hypothetical protein
MSTEPGFRRAESALDLDDDSGDLPVPLSTPFQREVVGVLRSLRRDVTALKTGQGELTAAFGGLVPRIAKLEGEAVWGRRLFAALKYAAPSIATAVALKWPLVGHMLAELAKGLVTQ